MQQKKRLFLHFFLAIAFLTITSTAFFLLSSSRTQADITAPANIITAQAVITAQSLMTDGADAIDMLGQYDDTSLVDPVVDYTKTGKNNGPNKLGFDQAKGIALDAVHHRLFVADYTNNRVLVYNLNVDDTLVDRIPDYVLGQANFYTNAGNGVTQSSILYPQALAYDPVGDRLFVAQYGIHRVSVFDVSTITNGENAINVLGQSLFTTSSTSATIYATTQPQGLAFDSVNQRLFVAQRGYNRVTVFDVTTITNGEDAINVLGQANFTTITAATTQAGLRNPHGLAYDEARQLLFIADENNNRVIVQNADVTTISNGQNASYVLGEALFTTSTNTTSQTSLATPIAVAYDSTGQRLFVSESGVVLVFDVSTISNGEAAINILGNTTYADKTETSISGMYNIKGMLYDEVNNYLYVSQGTNANRVSIFDTTSITNGENAIDLLGQDDGTSLTDPVIDFTKGGINNGANNLGFDTVFDVELDTIHHRLFVADFSNNRVLVYNLEADNSFSDRVPDYVLGQSTYTTNTGTTTQSGMYWPRGLAYDSNNDRLFVSLGFNRILVYDVSTITNGENAVNVLGQTTFTTGISGTTQVNLKNPIGLDYDESGDRLFVADTGNYRVLIYDVAPLTISNGKAASNVLGQPDFITAQTAQLTQSGLYYPEDVTYDEANKRLFVADSVGNRIIVYDLTTIQNGEAAVNVLGQTDFTSRTEVTTAAGLNRPSGVVFDEVNNRLFVADLSDNETVGSRVVVYDTAVITNGETAINILGKSNLNTTDGSTVNTAAKIYSAEKLALDTERNQLFVAQGTYGNRVSVFDIGQAGFLVEETEGSTNVTEGGGTDTFTVVLTAEPPTGDVVFDVSSDQATSANVSASTLTFTSANWNVPQTITVTALEDGNIINETATITISINTESTDDDFDTLPNQTVSVTVTDNDVASVILAESDGTTAAIEGETDSYTLVLTSEPTSDVTIDIAVDDQVSVDSSALTFTSGNWNVAQTVTVTAVDDRDVEEEHTGTISHTVSSLDENYDGLVVGDVVMTITDNDRRSSGTNYYGGPIIVTPTSCTITSPNGGEKWLAGSVHEITWTTAGTGIDNLVLYYRVDSDRAWTTIYAGTKNNGSFSWTLPNVSSQSVYVKADCRDSGAGTLASDVSNDAFTIITEIAKETVVPKIPTREEVNLVFPQNFPVDSLIKLKNDGNVNTQLDSAVYYLGLDGLRHSFPNEQIFLSWYSNFSLVQNIDAVTLASIPLGGPVLTRPGTYWVKKQSDPKTYYVAPGYALRWVKDEATAVILGGTDWNQKIMDLEPSLFARFTIGNPLSASDLTNSWPEGSLVREKGTSGLYYVDTAGVRPVSAAGLLANRFQEKFVEYTSSNAGWKSLPTANDITSFEEALFSELVI